MDIETVIQPYFFTNSEVLSLVNDRNSRVRAIGSYPEGKTVLMPLDGGGSALMFLREDSEMAEFICAGNTGGWMGTYAEAWIVNSLETNYEAESDYDAALTQEVFDAARENGLSVCMGGNDKPQLMIMSEQERSPGITSIHVEAFDIQAINDVVGEQVIDLENLVSPEADAEFAAAFEADGAQLSLF